MKTTLLRILVGIICIPLVPVVIIAFPCWVLGMFITESIKEFKTGESSL